MHHSEDGFSLTLSRSEPVDPGRVTLRQDDPEFPHMRTTPASLARLHTWSLRDPGFELVHDGPSAAHVLPVVLHNGTKGVTDTHRDWTRSCIPDPQVWAPVDLAMRRVEAELGEGDALDALIRAVAVTLAQSPPGWHGASKNIAVFAIAAALVDAGHERPGEWLTDASELRREIARTLARICSGDREAIATHGDSACAVLGRLAAARERIEAERLPGWEDAAAENWQEAERLTEARQAVVDAVIALDRGGESPR